MGGGDAAGVTARLPIALTIAGSDSGAGAGIQADIKTFAALGVYGASVVTALTAQNTRGVRAIHYPPLEIVAAQIDAVLEDFDVAAIKLGMLGMAAIVEMVADRLSAPLWRGVASEGWRAKRVRAIGPGPHPGDYFGHLLPEGEGKRSLHRLRSRHGRLLRRSARAALSFVETVRARLLPLVDCLTPNLAEAAALLGEPGSRGAKRTWRARARRCSSSVRARC